MYKRKRAGNTITRKINSTKDTAAKADKNHYISNSYLEGFIPIDTEYFTASFIRLLLFFPSLFLIFFSIFPTTNTPASGGRAFVVSAITLHTFHNCAEPSLGLHNSIFELSVYRRDPVFAVHPGY